MKNTIHANPLATLLARWALPVAISLAVNAAMLAAALWKVHKAFGWMAE